MKSNSRKKKQSQKKRSESLKEPAKKSGLPVTGSIASLSALDKTGFAKAIIETPKNSRNKYKFDMETGMFECSSVLQGGMTFPFDFGFIPSTRAEDGDPLDIIIFMDEPSFAGCLVHTRIIGVLEAQQTENHSSFRNDRLIGVHVKSVGFGGYMNWRELPSKVRDQIEDFFVYYNKCRGRVFEPLAWRGPKQAFRLLRKSLLANRVPGKKKSA